MVAEVDGLRVITANSCSLLRRVPEACVQVCCCYNDVVPPSVHVNWAAPQAGSLVGLVWLSDLLMQYVGLLLYGNRLACVIALGV